MEQKKTTKAQLEKRINNALVFVPKDKEYNTIYFSDKGLRLEVTEDKCVISTNYHKHIFDATTTSGESRPYIYTKRLIEIAYENDCVVGTDLDAHYSFERLKEVLESGQDKQGDYFVVCYMDWWLRNIFSPLYSITETEAGVWGVYLDFIHNVAYQSIVLDEHKEDLTNKKFLEMYLEKVKKFTKDIEERVVYKKLTDKEFQEQQMEAIALDENDAIVKDQMIHRNDKNEEVVEEDANQD